MRNYFNSLNLSRIISILIIEIENIFQHLFCLYGRGVRIESYCFHIAVKRMFPVALSAKLVTFPIPFFCRHNHQIVKSSLELCSQGVTYQPFFFPAFSVFIISEQMVMGPTPPGTGVI